MKRPPRCGFLDVLEDLLRRNRLGRAAALLAVIGCACIAGCGQSTSSPPVDVVQSYLNDLGAGNFSSACGLLTNHARHSPPRSVKAHVSCETLFQKCLPDSVINLPKDQTQLFYSSIRISTVGNTASATVSGTTVARAIRHVTLAQSKGNWSLTSYGKAVESCHLTKPRSH